MDITSSENKPVNREELKLGLDTISESARGLIKFVDTYRSLTRVSAPVKKAFYLQELIDRVTQLTREQIRHSSLCRRRPDFASTGKPDKECYPSQSHNHRYNCRNRP